MANQGHLDRIIALGDQKVPALPLTLGQPLNLSVSHFLFGEMGGNSPALRVVRIT